jgi:hypothetical protein
MSDLPEYLPVFILAAACWALCWAMLAQRLGYQRDIWIGILMVIPLVNVLTFLFLAFKESPNEARLRSKTSPESLSEEVPPSEVPETEQRESPGDNPA